MSQSETEVSPEDAMDTLKRQLGGQGLLVAAIIMLILTLAWTAMRIAARRIGGHKFLAADYFYFASQLGYIGVFTSAMIIIRTDLNTLLENPDTVQLLIHASMAMSLSHTITILCVKLSIGLLLLAVLGPTSRTMTVLCWAAVLVSVIWAGYGVVVTLVPTLDRGHVAAAYGIDIATDLILLILPWKTFKGLHMPWAHKVALILMFSGGFVTMAFSAAFLAVYRAQARLSTTIGVIQAGIAVMVASSTVLRPLFDRTIVRWFKLRSLRGTSNGTPHIDMTSWHESGGRRGAESGNVSASRKSARRIDRLPSDISESEENLTAQ